MELQASKTENLQNFRARLKAAMSRRGVTLQEVAQRLDISTSTVGAWTQGKNFPQTELQPALAAFLGTSIAHLFHGISVEAGAEFPQSLAEAQAPYLRDPRLAKIPSSPDLARGGPMERQVLLNPSFAPRPPEPTPQACIDYFLTYLKAAEHAPGGVGVLWWKLQKNFPLDEFQPAPK